jgi:quercetin dioxygenase-like cupin family protein
MPNTPLAKPQVVTESDLSWMPLREGLHSKPLRFFDNDGGYALMLRLEPGTEISLHRHTGEVHAYTVSGTRCLDTGELAGPGAYVYERPGNVDNWKAVGEEPLVVFVVVRGMVEYLDASGRKTGQSNATTVREAYAAYCARTGQPFHPLLEASTPANP